MQNQIRRIMAAQQLDTGAKSSLSIPPSKETLVHIIHGQPQVRTSVETPVTQQMTDALRKLEDWVPQDSACSREQKRQKGKLSEAISDDIVFERRREASMRDRCEAFWRWVPKNHDFRMVAAEEGYMMPSTQNDEESSTRGNRPAKRSLLAYRGRGEVDMAMGDTGIGAQDDTIPDEVDSQEWEQGTTKDGDMLAQAEPAADLEVVSIPDDHIIAESDQLAASIVDDSKEVDDTATQAPPASTHETPMATLPPSSKEDCSDMSEGDDDAGEPSQDDAKAAKRRAQAKARKARSKANKKAARDRQQRREQDVDAKSISHWTDEEIMEYMGTVPQPEAGTGFLRYVDAMSKLHPDRLTMLIGQLSARSKPWGTKYTGWEYFAISAAAKLVETEPHTPMPDNCPVCLGHFLGCLMERMQALHSWTAGHAEFSLADWCPNRNPTDWSTLVRTSLARIKRETLQKGPNPTSPTLGRYLVALLLAYARMKNGGIYDSVSSDDFGRIRKQDWWKAVASAFDNSIHPGGLVGLVKEMLEQHDPRYFGLPDHHNLDTCLVQAVAEGRLTDDVAATLRQRVSTLQSLGPPGNEELK